MLQFIAENNDKYTIAEQVQMAIEGGCKWVVLRVPDLSDGEIRELASEVVPLCQETSTILTIENHVELAQELHLHGVLLSQSPLQAAAVREMYGPEAIIGVQVSVASQAMMLKNADIDYVQFPASMPVERLSENVEALRNSEFMDAIVAEGNFTPDQLPCVLETGVNGIAVSSMIGEARDPVQTTANLLEVLNAK